MSEIATLRQGVEVARTNDFRIENAAHGHLVEVEHLTVGQDASCMDDAFERTIDRVEQSRDGVAVGDVARLGVHCDALAPQFGDDCSSGLRDAASSQPKMARAPLREMP